MGVEVNEIHSERFDGGRETVEWDERYPRLASGVPSIAHSQVHDRGKTSDPTTGFRAFSHDDAKAADV